MEAVLQTLGHFTRLDFVALAMLTVGWFGVMFLIEHPPRRFPSTSNLVAQYRREWMVQFVARDPRIFDSQVIGQLRQGTSFFASATLIAIGGTLALLGEVERLTGLADDLLSGTAPVIVWEVKILAIVGFLTNAFLKFVWANRLFGYCAVVMAAVPNDPADPAAMPRAQKAAEINITAARGFNRGLRSLYFALATAAWLIGSVALVLAVMVTLIVLLRREFASESRAVLMRPEDGGTDTRT